ncbi:PE-PPE domain-containing protein [Mycobacterium sp. SMC-4]|uniref:PE-PPE domain-containing protein n=1 Tax=Mycobacterium sp. SMC-4 TaxID=2857059 RepID=UPI003D08E78F
MTTGLALVGSSVIALAPLAPPAPADAASTSAVAKSVDQNVTLTARVITINPTPDALDMGEQLQGSMCTNGNTCYELDYRPVWSKPGYFGPGVEALKEALSDVDGEVTIFGFSEGAVVASQWLAAHLDDPEAYPAPDNLTFVVIGNPSRNYGGAGVPWGQKWPTSDKFKVVDVAQQYDPTVDMPSNPLNVLAVLNAAMGFFTNHLGDGYKDVDIDDEDNSRWEEDGVEYVFAPAKTLPILSPLYALGLDKLADELTGPLQYLIEQGYNRDGRITTTPIADPDAKSIFYAPINLLETIANIPYYAVQGTNNFAEAMRISGSWWVYTPTNVLGWDPANPLMTRTFVEFLVAIPSISGPLGRTADWWARANLPMNEGCTGFPPCNNPDGILDQMFKVMLWDFFNPEGFTFESPITPTHNPISDVEAFWGQELGLTGDPVEWHGETVYPKPFEETLSFWDHLISAPEGIKTPTLGDQLDAGRNLFEALMTTWYPFVPKSYVWNPKMTPFAYLARPLAKLLCPDCNKVDPFMPKEWKVGYDVYPGAYIPPSVRDRYDAETGKYIGPAIPGVADENDPDYADYLDKSGLGDLPAQDEDDEEGEADTAAAAMLVSRTAEVTEEADEAAEETSEDSSTPKKSEETKPEEKKDVVSEAVQGLLDKFGKAPVAEEKPVAEEAEEKPVAEEEPAADEEPTVDEKPVADKGSDDSGSEAESSSSKRNTEAKRASKRGESGSSDKRSGSSSKSGGSSAGGSDD